MSGPVPVYMTAEQYPHGYAQQLITIEREGARYPGWTVQTLMLTDGELAQLRCLLTNYEDGMAMGAASTSIRFADTSGRQPAVPP